MPMVRRALRSMLSLPPVLADATSRIAMRRYRSGPGPALLDRTPRLASAVPDVVDLDVFPGDLAVDQLHHLAVPGVLLRAVGEVAVGLLVLEERDKDDFA